jgi:peptide deformylase
VELTKELIEQLEIVKYPNPVLRQTAVKVERFDKNLELLVLKMLELMHSNKGVGLAANQVGIPLRLFVANHTGEPADDKAYINIEFLEAAGWAEAEEGCLSLPQIYGNVRRNQKVTIEAYDVKGNRFEIQAADLYARVLQHESDHLDGKMIIDRMNMVAKIANRRQIKYLEDLQK